MIKVNGQEKEITENTSLADFLAQEQYTTSRIAVELNGEIIPKTTYSQVLLHSGDVLEVVSFVGGG